ncbi:MAG: hypothetical protein PF961_13635 [Planctomycetota bacterium]|jgi:hypothetical protein|nr:hypothetical protein [Planctomycetota bacterium]
MGRVLSLVIIAMCVWWILARWQRQRSQLRLQRLGRALEQRGIDFQAWLREAGLVEAELKERRRFFEVQARLERAARRLLKA